VQKLHLVGFTTDRRGLIFSDRAGATSGSYVVDLDDSMVEAMRALGQVDEKPAPPRRFAPGHDGAAARPASALTVREMQARLRRGASMAEVAQTAGVAEDWVARFATPVFAEQAGVIRAVRAAYFDKPRLGTSALPLGEAVYRNLGDRGVNDPDEVLDGKWQAWQVRDNVWLVTFRHPWRGRDHEPAWELDQATGNVRALTRLAADLAFRPDDNDVPMPAGPAGRRVAAARPVPEGPVEIQLSLPVDPAGRRSR
jgi:hypothetical protein